MVKYAAIHKCFLYHDFKGSSFRCWPNHDFKCLRHCPHFLQHKQLKRNCPQDDMHRYLKKKFNIRNVYSQFTVIGCFMFATRIWEWLSQSTAVHMKLTDIEINCCFRLQYVQPNYSVKCITTKICTEWNQNICSVPAKLVLK